MKTFVLINMVAGILHYLFQVVAAQKLSAADFSSFSAWLAYLSFAFAAAAVLQYLSCFLPLPRRRLQMLLIFGAAMIAAVYSLPFVFGANLILLGALTALMSGALAIYVGQAQARLAFAAMASSSVLTGLAKLALVFIPWLAAAPVELFASAVVFSYVPALALLTFVLAVHQNAPATAATARSLPSALLATLILGAGSALFPQFELMMMKESQSPEVFEGFARLSLFYKAIFFAFLIFSQWLLPLQLRDQASASRRLLDFRMGGLAVGLAGLAAFTAPLAAHHILGWAEASPRGQVFLSCLNMALLTWLFLLLQEICAKRKLKSAAWLLAGVFAVVPLQLAAGLTIESYYAVAVSWNSFLIWRAVSCAGAANPKPS